MFSHGEYIPLCLQLELTLGNSDKNIVKDVFVTKDKYFGKGPFTKKVNIVNKELDVLTSHGAKWKHHRNLLNPSFSDTCLDSMFHRHILPCVNELVSLWDANMDKNNVVDVTVDMGRLVSDLFGRAGMGIEFGALKKTEKCFMQKTCDQSLIAMQLLIFMPMFVLKRLRFGALKDTVDTLYDWPKFLQDNLAERKKLFLTSENVKTGYDDLMSEMIKGGELTDDEIMSNMHILMLAGNETTIHTLEWVFFYLSRHDAVREKCYEEVKNYFAAHEQIAMEDAATGDCFKYVRAVVKESLRLRPPALFSMRQALQDVTLSNDLFIPKGTVVMPMIGMVHLDEDYYGPDAASFRPERFLEGEDRYTFVPFTVGPRTCLGKKFAEIEMTSFIASALRKFDIGVHGDPNKEMGETFAMTMHPSEHVMITLKKRQ